MKHANTFLAQLNNRRSQEFLKTYQKFISNNLKPQYEEIYNEERHLRLSLAKNFSGIPLINITDADLRRQIDLTQELQLIGLDDPDYNNAMAQISALRNVEANIKVCNLSFDCTSATKKYVDSSKIDGLINNAVDIGEIRYYYKEWRRLQPEIRGNYFQYLNSMRMAAALNGHVSPSRTWYLYFEEEHLLLNELEHAIKEIQPLYKQLQALVCHQIKQRFSRIDSNICSEGHIPDHIMDKVIAQSWRAKGCLTPPYPDTKLPNMQEKLSTEAFNAVGIVETASKFFEDMGMEPFSYTFGNRYSKKIENNGKEDQHCKAELYNFPPEVALRYCPKVDFKKFLQMHGHIAELHYNLKRKNLPFGLNKEACPGFSSAIGEAAVLSAGSPRYLEKIHMMKNYTLDSHLSMNRLFRLGVHTLFTVHRYFVYEKILVDSMDYRVRFEEINCAYWRYQDQFAGVNPPDQRDETTFDPGHKFFSLLNPEKPNTE